MTIGNTIANYRKQLGLTQEALAQKLGVTNQAVSKWELDLSCPDIQLLPALADLFGISIDAFFGRTPAASAPQLPWEDDGAVHAVVYIGHTLMQHSDAAKEITFTYDGAALDVHSDFSVNCGDVQGAVSAGGTVNCGDVNGCASAGGSVDCGDVNGNVSAGARVTCGDVHGDASAGGRVDCGDVEGDVHSGGDVHCCDVALNVDAGRDVSCGDIGGDLKAKGNVNCGDIGGGVIIEK